MRLGRSCRFLLTSLGCALVVLNMRYVLLQTRDGLQLTGYSLSVPVRDNGTSDHSAESDHRGGDTDVIPGVRDTIPFRITYPTMSNHTRIVATYRKQQGFMTIAIPSIRRINGIKYLLATIDSVIEQTTEAEKRSLVLLVFLCDTNFTYNSEVSDKLSLQYRSHISDGFVHLLQVRPEFYPRLTDLKRNFNDKPVRVTWRSKQVLDYAFMFMYAKDLSQYYLQLEDDVICAKKFVPFIQSYIQAQKKKTWALLEFSELGFIGKLFKSVDLPKLFTYMVTFFDEQPVDWLISSFRLSMGQRQVMMRKPTLFQHKGLVSSFDTTKQNKLKDKYFQDDVKNKTTASNKEPTSQPRQNQSQIVT